MKIDYEYEISEEQIVAYLAIPEIDRLRWLEELCVFTNMVRQAPDLPHEKVVIAESPANCNLPKIS
jgi:hypothetical protein